jgi:hypothetical protein
LKYSINSIEKHVFDVLSQNNITYDVFWHTVVSPSITNSHSRENDVALDEYDARLMMPCKLTLADEDSVSMLEFHRYCTAKSLNCSISKADREKAEWLEGPEENLWSRKFANIKHLITALHSKEMVLTMITNHMNANSIFYDAVIALRPDTAPITPIDLPQNLPLIKLPENQNKIWIPNYQDFNGYNDRAAYGPYNAMSAYLQMRGAYVDAPYVVDVHSEKFLYRYLKHFNYEVVDSSYRTVRIRADGCADNMDTWHMNLGEEKQEWLDSCFDKDNSLNGKSCPRLLLDNC